MSFWAPALNSPAENSIPKKPLDTSLETENVKILHTFLITSLI